MKSQVQSCSCYHKYVRAAAFTFWCILGLADCGPLQQRMAASQQRVIDFPSRNPGVALRAFSDGILAASARGNRNSFLSSSAATVVDTNNKNLNAIGGIVNLSSREDEALDRLGVVRRLWRWRQARKVATSQARVETPLFAWRESTGGASLEGFRFTTGDEVLPSVSQDNAGRDAGNESVESVLGARNSATDAQKGSVENDNSSGPQGAVIFMEEVSLKSSQPEGNPLADSVATIVVRRRPPSAKGLSSITRQEDVEA